MNKAILIGNLTRDPESRQTGSGLSVCTFSIAVNRRFINKQTGQREVDFFNIVCWREQADLAARYLSKGRKVAVVGNIQNRTYDAQDGTKRYVTEIVADEVEFLSSPQQGGSAGSYDEVPPPPEPTAPRSSGSSAPRAAAPATGFNDVEDDELPF